MTKLLHTIDGPADLDELDDDKLATGGPGGARADHRDDRRDRWPLRREPGRVRDRGGPPLPPRFPARQDPLGRGPPGLSAQGAHGPARAARHDPQVRGPRPVLRNPRVRARHHGRRPRVHIGVLRGRDQGGDAPRPRARRQGRGRDRGRRPDGGVAFEALLHAGGLDKPISSSSTTTRCPSLPTSGRCRGTSTGCA